MLHKQLPASSLLLRRPLTLVNAAVVVLLFPLPASNLQLRRPLTLVNASVVGMLLAAKTTRKLFTLTSVIMSVLSLRSVPIPVDKTGPLDRCVTYRRASPLHHSACTEASFKSCFTTRKFRSGRLLMAEESAVFSRRSNKQTMTLVSIIKEAVAALFPSFTLHSASMLGELCAVPDVPAAVRRRQWKPGLLSQHCCSCCRCFRPCCSRPPPSEDQRPAAQSGGVGV